MTRRERHYINKRKRKLEKCKNDPYYFGRNYAQDFSNDRLAALLYSKNMKFLSLNYFANLWHKYPMV